MPVNVERRTVRVQDDGDEIVLTVRRELTMPGQAARPWRPFAAERAGVPVADFDELDRLLALAESQGVFNP